MSLQRFVDMRYLGQWRSMSIAVAGPITSLDDAIATFHDEHGREHNYKRPDAPVEIYRLGVTAVGLTPKAELARYEVDGISPSQSRPGTCTSTSQTNRSRPRSTIATISPPDWPSKARRSSTSSTPQPSSRRALPRRSTPG